VAAAGCSRGRCVTGFRGRANPGSTRDPLGHGFHEFQRSAAGSGLAPPSSTGRPSQQHRGDGVLVLQHQQARATTGPKSTHRPSRRRSRCDREYARARGVAAATRPADRNAPPHRREHQHRERAPPRGASLLSIRETQAGSSAAERLLRAFQPAHHSGSRCRRLQRTASASLMPATGTRIALETRAVPCAPRDRPRSCPPRGPLRPTSQSGAGVRLFLVRLLGPIMASRIPLALAICTRISTATPATARSEHATRVSTAASSSRSHDRHLLPAHLPSALPEAREHHVPHERRVRTGGGLPALPALSPECAPDLAGWRATSRSVSRALAVDRRRRTRRGDVDGLAMRPASAERQLRRLFDKHLGASPIAVARRVACCSRTVLHETRMKMVDVAFAAGFGSLRRFNDTSIDSTDSRPPRCDARRRRGGRDPRNSAITLTLGYAAPYDWPR